MAQHELQLGDLNQQVTADERGELRKSADILTHEAQLRWGTERVKITPGDPMEALSVLVLGPDACHLLGSETAGRLARESVVFGAGLSQGMANAAAKQNTQELVSRASTNASTGAALGILTEAHPLSAAAVGTGASLAWLYHEVGPDSAGRNRELGRIWQQAWNDDSNIGLQKMAARVGELGGADAFDNAFDMTTGAFGCKGAHSLAHAENIALPKLDIDGLGKCLSSEFDAWINWLGRAPWASRMKPVLETGPADSTSDFINFHVSNGENFRRKPAGGNRPTLVPDAIVTRLAPEERETYTQAIKNEKTLDVQQFLTPEERSYFKMQYEKQRVGLHQACAKSDRKLNMRCTNSNGTTIRLAFFWMEPMNVLLVLEYTHTA